MLYQRLLRWPLYGRWGVLPAGQGVRRQVLHRLRGVSGATKTCVKPPTKKDCPPNYALLEGCCVCLPRFAATSVAPIARRTSVWAGSAARNAASMVRRAATARSAVGSAVSTPEGWSVLLPLFEDVNEAEGKLILKQAQDTVDWVKAKDSSTAWTPRRKMTRKHGPTSTAPALHGRRWGRSAGRDSRA